MIPKHNFVINDRICRIDPGEFTDVANDAGDQLEIRESIHCGILMTSPYLAKELSDRNSFRFAPKCSL